MNLAMNGLDLDFAELSEFTFGFFCHIANLLKTDFVHYLEAVMPRISSRIQSCEECVVHTNN